MINRISHIQHTLSHRKIDAILISQPDNRRYLSGFTAVDHNITESSGLLLIPQRGTPHLLTDFRYQIQAERDTTDFEIHLYQRGVFSLLKKLLPQLGITTLAIEANYFLHSKYLTLAKLGTPLGLHLIALDDTIEKLRQTKSDDELASIQKSVSLNEAVFQHVLPQIKAGQTEIQVSQILENTMRQFGAERPSFDTIVASGPNGALPHAVPGPRQLRSGEPIIIDMGLVLAGYCSDMTRTIVLGTPDTETITLFRLVRRAQLAAIEGLKPGVSAKKIDQAARSIIAEAGHGPNFGHALGHGVGLAVHESPSINTRNRKLLRPGMVVTIEPGIYIKGWGGIRLENMVVITNTGHKVLNQDTSFLDL
ncbi:MAG: Xaa-Pro peptidase family protein [Proteobacteria bacterium]|nr:aminopeptidase P family protein [Desulfobulbaceae bacterium]MBU4151885.1 Xaa-Pro peptidase family protein [Pseudomonadota bacterium]MDP2106723.1 Xaa-Pro peptidase family protein [Desulfobulbaceae bacterium]